MYRKFNPKMGKIRDFFFQNQDTILDFQKRPRSNMKVCYMLYNILSYSRYTLTVSYLNITILLKEDISYLQVVDIIISAFSFLLFSYTVSWKHKRYYLHAFILFYIYIKIFKKNFVLYYVLHKYHDEETLDSFIPRS